MKFFEYSIGALHRIKLYHYRYFLMPRLVKRMRCKKKIRVLFMLSDLAFWKSEGLYQAMLAHPRFEPVLGTALICYDIASESMRKYATLIDYLKNKGYDYKEIYDGNLKDIAADIAFFQQPYDGFLPEAISYSQMIRYGTLICDTNYAFRTLAVAQKNEWVIDLGLHRFCWTLFFENELTKELGQLSLLKGKNIKVTGIPMQDELVKDKDHFNNSWKKQSRPKKRIIFAPHHTIPTFDNWITYSNFMEVADLMLDLAEKYSDEVQFAFKPHPFLKRRLYDAWGNDKTERYYKRWATGENTQLVEGSYQGLFKHSDALIHDCGSFTVEYCYEKKPAMYLIREEKIVSHRNELNEFGQMAFDLHTHGVHKEEIEAFILQVVAGEDPLKHQREEYYKNYLLPPHGKTASQNIINAILGEEEYKE